MRRVAVLLSCLGLAAQAGDPPPLRVRLSEQPVEWRLQGAAPLGSASAAEGELVRLTSGGELVWAVSEGERELSLVRVGETFVWRRDGEPVPFDARVYVDRRDRKAEPVVTGELLALDTAQRKHLRTVQVAAWTEQVAEAVGELDLERCRIELGREALLPLAAGQAPATLVLPLLPAGVRHLAIRCRSWRAGERLDLSTLASLEGLRTLELDLIRGPAPAVADWSPLAGLRALTTLILRGGPADLSPLANMSGLRVLELQGCPAGDLAPLAKLARLERAVLEGVGASSLAPLAGLPALTLLRAPRSAVEELAPEGFGALRELDLMGSLVEEPAAAAFRAAHPACRVRCGWNALLREETRGVDRVRVRSGGTCHRDPKAERTLLELSGDEVAWFLGSVEVVEEPPPELIARLRAETLGKHDRDGDGKLGPEELPPELAARLGVEGAGGLDEAGLTRAARRTVRSGFHCMCCGDPSFELYAGPTLVATLGFHHAQSLRWPGGWPADGGLTPASREALSKLVSKARPGTAPDQRPPPVFEGPR